MKKRRRFVARYLHGMLTTDKGVTIIMYGILFIPCLFAAAIAAVILF